MNLTGAKTFVIFGHFLFIKLAVTFLGVNGGTTNLLKNLYTCLKKAPISMNSG